MRLTPETILKNALQGYPNAKPLFEKYFGKTCYTCKEYMKEPIKVACYMNDVDPEIFIKEVEVMENEYKS